MITVTLDPVIVQIGHLALRWYGLIVATAILIGVNVGARVFHVLDHWSHGFSDDPVRILYVWQGGLAIWGGVVGGLLGAVLFAWRRWRGAVRRQLARLLDAAAPGLVLAQAIGRTACIITGDAMGKPTTGPFGFAYSSPNAMVPELGVFYTPNSIYTYIVHHP